MNTAAFLKDQRRYFLGAYQQFCAFGGPCVHFHRECLRAADVEFLSDRHVEMLYATLTAWGMHRMGDIGKTKAKLTNWDLFRSSLQAQRDLLEPLQKTSLLSVSERQYDEVLVSLMP